MIELGIGSIDANRIIIVLAYIEIELQHHPVRYLLEEKKEAAAYVSKAHSLVRRRQNYFTPHILSQQAHSFCIETMPVPKKLKVGGIAEIRCQLVRNWLLPVDYLSNQTLSAGR